MQHMITKLESDAEKSRSSNRKLMSDYSKKLKKKSRELGTTLEQVRPYYEHKKRNVALKFISNYIPKFLSKMYQWYSIMYIKVVFMILPKVVIFSLFQGKLSYINNRMRAEELSIKYHQAIRELKGAQQMVLVSLKILINRWTVGKVILVFLEFQKLLFYSFCFLKKIKSA